MSGFLPPLVCAAEGPADWLAKIVLDKAGVRHRLRNAAGGRRYAGGSFGPGGGPRGHALAPDARAAEARTSLPQVRVCWGHT